MTFVSIARPRAEHACTVPPRAGYGAGTVWKCDECGVHWGVTSCFGDHLTWDWRRMADERRFLNVFDTRRFPTSRQPEPSA
jgi:hypothetical protein